MKHFALLAFLALNVAVPAFGQSLAPAPKVAARLVADHTSVAPGSSLRVALEEKIPPGWHTYWVNPGDAGAPTEIAWRLPPGWNAGAIAWPAPKRLPVGPLMDYGYEGTLWLVSEITVPKNVKAGDTVVLQASVSWLVCKEICIPEDTKLTLPLKIGASVPDPAVAGDFARAASRLPVPSPWPMRYRLGSELDLFVAAPGLSALRPVAAAFFPRVAGQVKNAAPQILGFARGGLVLRLQPDAKPPDSKTALEGVLILADKVIAVAALPGPVPPADFPATENAVGGAPGLALALLFAFIGGLILNVMPCVLPVLAMKALALAQTGREGARDEGLAYAGGAILSFLAFGLAILLLRQGGAAIGWGFQLQDPRAVGGFALLIFAVGLNLSGVFEFSSVSAGDRLTRRAGSAGAFFTGVLAVGVAAPCTAPFMAAALGVALAGPAAEALGIFFALGLGFALPFLLLALWPAACRLLPKPGFWMLRLKQFLAFPMYAATAWLVWVLTWQAGANGVAILLAAMIILGFATWLWSTTRGEVRPIGATASLLCAIAALCGLAFLHSSPPETRALGREAYSVQRLEVLRARGTPVFIDATAAWCITCLVNEQAVLSRDDVKAGFASRHVAILVADWTNRDAAVTALIEAQGRSGVPLYLYYAPGAATPEILPQILTGSRLLTAIGAN